MTEEAGRGHKEDRKRQVSECHALCGAIGLAGSVVMAHLSSRCL